MKVAELIAARTPEWKQLESDISWCRDRRHRDPARLALFARRYRAACGDLSLAIAMRFPASTTQYLHELVADAHTQLYRADKFRISQWGRTVLVDVPRRILRDPCTWIASFVFWGLFGGAMLAGVLRDDFAGAIVGSEALAHVEDMYAKPMESEFFEDSRAAMTGFYLFNNAGIGLRCFASGIFLGVGSLMALAFNAIFLGAIFGHMIRSPSSANFLTFVTAHGPFELTAIVLSGAAGLRLGWAIIDTGGWSRKEALRRTAPRALEIAGVATILFLFAAYIEGSVSPSELPYVYKALTAIFSTLLLLAYIVALGLRPSGERHREA
jgi:uncharacterized membrane protein SpoIIM required for sporulation